MGVAACASRLRSHFMRLLDEAETPFNKLQAIYAQNLIVAYAQERIMVRYEILTCRKGRWTTDGILDTRNAAVEHAQTLADRNYLIRAVRVMALEDSPKGFREQIVYNREVFRVPAAKPQSAIGKWSQAIGKPNAKPGVPSGANPRLVVVVLVIACAVLMGYGLLRPQTPWIFDTPDAQKPHLLHNPFTGEFR